MKNKMLSKEDGEKLVSIYRIFYVDRTLKRPLTADEMILIYTIANELRKGESEDKNESVKMRPVR